LSTILASRQICNYLQAAETPVLPVKLLYADTEYPFQCELFHSPSISGGTNIERASAGRLQRYPRMQWPDARLFAR